jgi:hypothetical protein
VIARSHSGNGVEVYVNGQYQYTEGFNAFEDGARDFANLIRSLETELEATPITDPEVAGAYRFWSNLFIPGE